MCAAPLPEAEAPVLVALRLRLQRATRAPHLHRGRGTIVDAAGPAVLPLRHGRRLKVSPCLLPSLNAPCALAAALNRGGGLLLGLGGGVVYGPGSGIQMACCGVEAVAGGLGRHGDVGVVCRVADG